MALHLESIAHIQSSNLNVYNKTRSVISGKSEINLGVAMTSVSHSGNQSPRYAARQLSESNNIICMF